MIEAAAAALAGPFGWALLAGLVFLAFLIGRAGRAAPDEPALAPRIEQLAASVEGQGARLEQTVGTEARRSAAAIAALSARLASVEGAEARLGVLAREVRSLTEALAGPRGRGVFGEAQLAAILRDRLPPVLVLLQHRLGNGTIVDAALRLADPPGLVPIDSKFPLDAFRALRASTDEEARSAALRRFAADLRRHLGAVAEKYLIPGETASFAILFVPSEAVHAAILSDLPALVEEAVARRVLVLSPSGLSVLLDVLLSLAASAPSDETAAAALREAAGMAEEARRIMARAEQISRSLDRLREDVRAIDAAAHALALRAGRIEARQAPRNGDGA